jgi:hypothetical protein
MAVVTGGPRLGDMEAGTVAAITSPRVSVISGGVGCMIGIAVLARAIPELAGWTTDSYEED